jgi:L-fuconolactonase
VIIDAHQHFWDPATADYPWLTDEVAELRRRFGPEDLEPLLAADGVAGTILVQARHSLDETEMLLEIAAHTPFVLGVVGWVDLTGDVRAQLGELAAPLVGVRHQVHDEPDAGWLLRDDVQQGLAALAEAGLVYDLLVRARELPAALETARRHPGLTFVLDHVAKRPSGDDADWAAGVAALGELPNVVCKLSGLFTEADPAGTAERALHWFGTERCLHGSDWPVCTLAASYRDTLALVRTIVPAHRLDAVLGGNAARTYGLKVENVGR